jgi:AAA+ superfamily predicted ATPase
MPREPTAFLPLLDSFLRSVTLRSKPLGVTIIFSYAETLIPESSENSGAEDRAARVFIQKWATDPALLSANVTLVLLTENLSDISSRIVRSPQTIEIEVARPEEPERCAFLSRFARTHGSRKTRPDRGAARTDDVRADARAAPADPVVGGRAQDTARRVLLRTEESAIEAECFGLLGCVESKFTLDMVSGHEGVKERLRRAAGAIAAGRLRGVPMGYLIGGPVGSAKSFLVNCFTGELGFPCVKFMNFRSQWQGVTEGNLEKILTLLRSIWPVGVIIDEADAFLGDRNQQGDSGTSNRVFAQISSFMGNTEYRGKILWFLITCRPDLLPVDLKRQGRAEEHFALFYPETDEEYEALFRIMLKKGGLTSTATSITQVLPNPAHSGLSGADFEAIIARAALMADAASSPNGLEIPQDVLARAFADFIPATSPLERELQILAAVLECTSREILPPRYRAQEREGMLRRIQEIKSMLAGQ